MTINWRHHGVLASCIGVLISLVLAYYGYQGSGLSFLAMLTHPPFWKYFLLSFILAILIYATNLLSSIGCTVAMDRRERNRGVVINSGFRNVILFLNGMIVSIISYYLYLGVLLKVFVGISVTQYLEGGYFSFGNFLGVVLLSVFILMLVFVFAYTERIRQLELRNKEMEIALQRSQIESMREQLSPHFLFNNLNVLISTIQEDPEKAEQFARSFSKIYRYVLEKLETTTSALADEITFIKDYVYLLNVRYDNAIDFEIADEVEEYDQVEVPTLCLQILIENVVKHNTIPSEGRLVVKLTVEENRLVLWNVKSAKPKQVYSSGVGLANLSKRCEILFKEDIEVQEASDYFSVRMPLMRKDRT